MLTLIGSRALMMQASRLLKRKPLDFDFIGKREDIENWISKNAAAVGMTERYEIDGGKKIIVKGSSILEFEVEEENLSAALFTAAVAADPDTKELKGFGAVPSLDALFTLKTSHRYKKNSPHFWKTLHDWHIMRAGGAIVREEYKEFLKVREKETYTEKLPSLTNQTKNSFFSGDGITYIYDHDSIHEAVKHLDRPAYTYYAKDGDPIKSDKKKFFEADEQIRIYGAIEEIACLACERALSPHPNDWTPESAWRFSYAKCATSITSGFFREFIFENAIKILQAYPADYYEKFKLGLANGTVKKVA